jgi:hypothetical protein
MISCSRSDECWGEGLESYVVHDVIMPSEFINRFSMRPFEDSSIRLEAQPERVVM